MKDLRDRLNKLRAEAALFARMGASDPDKRELFERLANELAIEALELEQVVKRQDRRSGYSDPANVVILENRSERK